MAHSVRPSLAYFGSQADHAISDVSSGVRSVFDRIRAALNSLSSNLRSASYGLRQEVPFERWFYDNGFQTPLDKPVDLIKAHAWAVFATCEGAIRLAAEGISYVFSLAFSPQNSSRHIDVLKAQMQGLSLSLLAIVSPNSAKSVAHNGGSPLIGASLLTWKWGSLYMGKVDAPFWHVESNHYPWAPIP